MKFVVISDTHTKHDLTIVEPCDALIHGGDLSYNGTKEEMISFLNWFSKQPAKHLIFIAGNHDFYFDSNWAPATVVGSARHSRRYKAPAAEIKELLSKYPNVIYLNDSGCEVEGIKIWGSPVSPWFHDWGFNRYPGEDIQKHWNLIPTDTDIIVTHGPPFGYGDRVAWDGQYVGCKDLKKTIWANPNIKVSIFGHIHEGYGVHEDGERYFINASQLNENYSAVNKPVVFTIDESKKVSILPRGVF